jgi:PPOX class probable F420-dependent enzyme
VGNLRAIRRYSWDPAARTVRISTTADRAKVRHLRRDPPCAFIVSSDDRWSFAVVEGDAELSPVSATPGDEVGQELLRMQQMPVEPQDQDAFYEQMVADRRLVIRLRASRL